jgi:glutathione synthase/RimK-type ligase-like ATP-grasp enzyme
VRVALATASWLPELDEDGPLLLPALRDEGVEPVVAVWDDPAVDWDSFDLVVVHTTWDYWDKHEAFVAWARSVPRLRNSGEVIAWNTDKTYLRELEAAGVPIVRTTWVGQGDAFDVPDHPFVVKPTVSAGAKDSAAYPAGDTAARQHVEALLARGKTVMVQPYVSAVDERGETSVLAFDGEISHAARKSAILRVGAGVDNAINSRAFISPTSATHEELALAEQVLAAVPHELLYARVDLLPGPVLIELEVTEPSLFLRHAPGSAQRFARAIARAAAATSRS